MTEIFDIKTSFFGIFLSYQYVFLFFFVVFLSGYYFLLEWYLRSHKSTKIYKTPENMWETTHHISQHFLYLKNHIETFEKSIFYREVGLYIRKCIFEIYGDSNIFFMTYSEIAELYPSKYQWIFGEVYLFEFDAQKKDSLEKRLEILKKIEEITE